MQHDDSSWEAIAPWFIKYSSQSTVGVETINAWADTLPSKASILDIGSGPGSPRSAVLANRGFTLYAVEASPTLANAYQKYFPHAHVVCELVEDSHFFDRIFDGVLAWGLMFLLPADAQQVLICKIAEVLKSNGKFLFTAPAQACTWKDLSTGLQSLSLGTSAYKAALTGAGLKLHADYKDERENHYYEAYKL